MSNRYLVSSKEYFMLPQYELGDFASLGNIKLNEQKFSCAVRLFNYDQYNKLMKNGYIYDKASNIDTYYFMEIDGSLDGIDRGDVIEIISIEPFTFKKV